MAQYKLLQMAYINNCLHGEGAIVTVRDDMIPGPHMLPVDAEAKRMAKAIGLVNDVVPDYVDEQTGMVDVSKYGASPQNIAAGVALNAEVDGLPGADHLRTA